MVPAYNKLVRDRIPEIIRQAGAGCRTRTLSGEELRSALTTKLDEEIAEYRHASTDRDRLEELGDVLEVLYALARYHGSSPDQLLAVNAAKRQTRGGFEKALWLVDTDDR